MSFRELVITTSRVLAATMLVLSVALFALNNIIHSVVYFLIFLSLIFVSRVWSRGYRRVKCANCYNSGTYRRREVVDIDDGYSEVAYICPSCGERYILESGQTQTVWSEKI